MKKLFRQAREKAPSIIFIDQMDSLFASHLLDESMSSRRIKTAFFEQMRGDDRILVLGATSAPWLLDSALLQRFEVSCLHQFCDSVVQKRIYIPLPNAHARSTISKLNMGAMPSTLTDDDYSALGERTEGYSGELS